MTDAFASRNVSDAKDTATINEVKKDTNRNNTNDENCLPQGSTTNLNSNCTETNDSKVETQIPSNILSNSSKNDNITNNNIDNPHGNQTVVIGTGNHNIVLKYVYKKNEVKDIPTKTTGHPKNTLRRRKRSENLENLDGTKAPLIVNYETSHSPQRDVEVWLPARNTANVIKHSALADFNIETLHDTEQLKKNINGPSTETIPENANDSNESVDRENYKNNNANSRDNSEESNEQNNGSSENSNESEQYPRNNEQYSEPRENHRNENSNDERDRHSSIELENADAKNSREQSDSREYDKSKYTTSPNGVNESAENSFEVTEKSTASYPSNDERPNSEEELNSKYKTKEKYKFKPEYDSKTSPPANIQDVDLGEYERIQVNERGEIETAKDTHENTAFDPAIDVILTTKPDTRNKESEKISSLSKDNTDSSSLESHDQNEPTHINDGEVKPVVEINSDSSESSDENSNEALKAKLENESLETLTGVNEKDSTEKSDKLQDGKKSLNKGDVKQQFERIPLNYNHADKKQSKDSNVEAKEQTNDNGNDEGTIDKLKPRYDENLNIKFDDINIKLPEIKLPDDILSYAYEDPPVYKDEQREKPSYYQDTSNYNNRNEHRDSPPYYQDSSIYNKNKEAQREKSTYDKQPSIYKNKEELAENPKYYRNDREEKQIPRFYHYNDEDQDEQRAPIKQEEDDEPNDDRNDYYGHYVDGKKKEDYKQRQNNIKEEDDDLYEKFVRERFGKRGTFEKRLEKLTDYKAQNPHLYQKVQNILKKTKEVKSEAEKSGDPNAGYMWTLEYGDKL